MVIQKCELVTLRPTEKQMASIVYSYAEGVFLRGDYAVNSGKNEEELKSEFPGIWERTQNGSQEDFYKLVSRLPVEGSDHPVKVVVMPGDEVSIPNGVTVLNSIGVGAVSFDAQLAGRQNAPPETIEVDYYMLGGNLRVKDTTARATYIKLDSGELIFPIGMPYQVYDVFDDKTKFDIKFRKEIAKGASWIQLNANEYITHPKDERVKRMISMI